VSFLGRHLGEQVAGGELGLGELFLPAGDQCLDRDVRPGRPHPGGAPGESADHAELFQPTERRLDGSLVVVERVGEVVDACVVCTADLRLHMCLPHDSSAGMTPMDSNIPRNLPGPHRPERHEPLGPR